jgi:hypothetical protein
MDLPWRSMLQNILPERSFLTNNPNTHAKKQTRISLKNKNEETRKKSNALINSEEEMLKRFKSAFESTKRYTAKVNPEIQSGQPLNTPISNQNIFTLSSNLG